MSVAERIDISALGKLAREASYELARASTAVKNAALLAMADALDADAAEILAANALDLEAGRASGLTDSLLDRLNLQNRLAAIAQDVRTVADLPDPVGSEFDQRTLENGLRVSRRRTPLGVLGVIYEARPNVTVDVAALSVKSGNAVILRGGKESLHSNRALVASLRRAIVASGLPADAIQFIDSTEREYIHDMLKAYQYIDLIIPRGGNSLHTYCRENSTIPVITGGVGVCHLYVDVSADVDQALPVIYNAKTHRPSVCNSLDTVLVNAAVAAEVLPRIVAHLAPAGVTFKADERASEILAGVEGVDAAGEEDFDTEWMALILGLKVVDSLDEAIVHIRTHSMDHSDGILSQDAENIARFLNEVNSSAVFVNASTRFNDGGALGLGAEIAVSTQKLHARGPMALEELTTYKWVVVGDGHVRG